jgi:hypothetical protein
MAPAASIECDLFVFLFFEGKSIVIREPATWRTVDVQ